MTVVQGAHVLAQRIGLRLITRQGRELYDGLWAVWVGGKLKIAVVAANLGLCLIALLYAIKGEQHTVSLTLDLFKGNLGVAQLGAQVRGQRIVARVERPLHVDLEQEVHTAS